MQMYPELRKEYVTYMSRSRTICTSYVDKLPKNITTQIYIALPFLKMIFTLIPVIPVLLATEEDEETGYFYTHFLFFTNNLAHNTKHYMSTAAENLKLKLWENNMVILMSKYQKYYKLHKFLRSFPHPSVS
jgi:hypothetical protein